MSTKMDVSLILRGVRENPLVELDRRAFDRALRAVYTENKRSGHDTRDLELKMLTDLCIGATRETYL